MPILLTRRSFLATTGTAAASLAIPACLYAADTAPRKVRVGIVGGRFGLSFQFHEHPDCEVVAVSDLRPERREQLMKTYNCSKAYDSLEQMVLDKSIDAVAIFTEGPAHLEHATLAMHHDKHVLSAVPAV